MMGGRRLGEVKRRRHTAEQVVRKLREADRILGEGGTIPVVVKQLEVSDNTFHCEVSVKPGMAHTVGGRSTAG